MKKNKLHTMFVGSRSQCILYDPNNQYKQPLKDRRCVMTVGELAVNVDLLNKLNLISMYAESYQKQTMLSENPMDVLFGINTGAASKEHAVEFMCSYLSAFTGRMQLEENDFVIIYLPMVK